MKIEYKINHKTFIVLFLLLFFYNIVKFMNMPESELPILNTLFSMILFLSLVILLIHKKDLFGRKNNYQQEKLDKYLKKD